jgi:hypothetical protein
LSSFFNVYNSRVLDFENIHHGLDRVTYRPEEQITKLSASSNIQKYCGVWNIPPRTLAEQLTFSDQITFSSIYNEIADMTRYFLLLSYLSNNILFSER